MMRRYTAPPKSPLAVARVNAHRALDCLWRFGAMSRSEAYAWLSDKMNVPPQDCHIGMFDEAQCAEVIRLCDERT